MTTRSFNARNGVSVGASIDVITAAGQLTPAAGTTTAATIQLTSGSLLTSPLAGAIEFDGTSLYITNSSNTRQTLLTSASLPYIGTTQTQAASANQAVTGVLSIAMPGATSGTATLTPPATAAGTITLPNATSTLATLALTETLTNKTLTSPIINTQVTTASTSINLWNTTATTINFGQAATALSMGATTGTLTLRNPTIVGSQTTQALFNTVATTLNIGGAATTLTLGAATGTTTIGNNLAVSGTGTSTFAGPVSVTGTVTASDPTANNHLATKSYVDSYAAGINVHSPVRVATTAALTATYSNGTAGVGATLTGTGALPTIDGVTLAASDRVLVKNQATQTQNGVYTVTTLSPNWVLTRATDFDNSPSNEVTSGDFLFVNEGTANANSQWVMTTTGTITIGTSNLVFTQFGGAASLTWGAGLSATGNTINVGTASTARIVVNADDIDLATVTDAGTGSFVKITRDSYGRVTGTTSVLAADITPLVDGTYFNITGDNVTGPSTFVVNSASDAVRITQTGTGNALVVEDAANPDSTPFIIEANGTVVRGHTARLLMGDNIYTGIQSLGTDDNAGFSAARFSADAVGPDIQLVKGRGAIAVNSTAVTTSDFLGEILWAGSNGTNLNSKGASIQAQATGAFTTTSAPSRLIFSTSASGSIVPTSRMEIDATGAVTMSNSLTVTNGIVGSRVGVSSTTGTASSPDIYWSNDTGANTGFYRSGENILSVAAGAIQLADFNYGTGLSTSFTRIYSTTPSTSSTTGGLVVDGGLGVAGAINAGSTIIGTRIGVTSTTGNAATSPDIYWVNDDASNLGFYRSADDALVLAASSGDFVEFNATDNSAANRFVRIGATNNATSTTTGALRVDGGAGFSGDVYATSFHGTLDASDLLTGTVPNARLSGTYSGITQLNVGGTWSTVLGTTAETPTVSAGEANQVSIGVGRYQANAAGPYFNLTKSRGATVGSHGAVLSGDVLGTINVVGSDGTNWQEAAAITAIVDGTPAAGIMPGRISLQTRSDGNPIATLGAITAGSGYTSGSYTNVRLTGGLGLGATANITVTAGAVTAVTLVGGGYGYRVGDTLSAPTGVIGAGTGFSIPVASVTASTSAAERFRVDSSGNVGIGNFSLANINLRVQKDIYGGATSYGIYVAGGVQPDVTSAAYAITSSATVNSSAESLPTFAHFFANPGAFGTRTVSNHYGFLAASAIGDKGTTNFGFTSNLVLNGTTNWNFYASGTAPNYFAGQLLFGSTTSQTLRNGSTSVTGIALQNLGANLANASSSNVLYNASVSGPQFHLAHSRGASLNANGALTTSDEFGQVVFGGNDGTQFSSGASIVGVVDTGTVSTTSMPGALSLRTTATGTITPVERIRVYATGSVHIGGSNTTSVPAGATDGLLITATNGTQAILSQSSATSSIIDLIPDATDGTSSAAVRLFRSTNTTGTRQLQILRGDGTTTIDHLFNSGATAFSSLARFGGRVAIGTTTDDGAGTLQVTGPAHTTVAFRAPGGDGASTPGFSWQGNTGMGVFRETADTFGFSTAGIGRLYVHSDGVIGTSTEATRALIGNTTGKFNVVGVGALNQTAIVMARFDNGTTGPRIIMGKSRGATVGNFATAVLSGDELGSLRFAGSDTVDATGISAIIQAEATETYSTTASGSRVFISTIANGTNTLGERLSITSASLAATVPLTVSNGGFAAASYNNSTINLYGAGTGGALTITAGAGPTSAASLTTASTGSNINFVLQATTAASITQYGVNAIAGTAALPSFTFINDPDTGMYSSGTNTVGFAAGGTRFMNASAATLTVDARTSLATTGNSLSVASATGVTLTSVPGTITDSAAAATIANGTAHSFAVPTFTAVNTGRIYTNASTVYIAGAAATDATGGNTVTLTNTHALHVAAGRSFFPAGSAATPSIAMRNADTGFYSSATSTVNVTTAGTLAATFSSVGDFTAVGNVTAYSDARLKKDVVTIDNALAKVEAMRGVNFKRIDNDQAGTGVIAQEVQEIVPEVIVKDEEGTLSVAYGNLVGVLIEAVKELSAKVKSLEAQLEAKQ